MARKRMAAIELPSVDSLFTSQEERESERSERVALVPMNAVEPFPGHPFRASDDKGWSSSRKAWRPTASSRRSR